MGKALTTLGLFAAVILLTWGPMNGWKILSLFLVCFFYFIYLVHESSVTTSGSAAEPPPRATAEDVR